MSDFESVYVKLGRCEPGMRLAEDVHNEMGAVVIKEGTLLDERLIKWISQFSIERVRVFVDKDDRHKFEDLRKEAEYSENVDEVKEMIYDISKGKALNMGAVSKVTASLGSEFNDLGSVLGCISQMRDTDEYTYSHSINVSLLCMLMGKWLKLGSDRVNELSRLGLLHDIGKGMIDINIINKPGKLDKNEFEEIKKHPALGYRLLQKTDIGTDVSMGVLLHHEKGDGSGYPMGLKLNQLTLYSKVCTIADIYAAMTSNRPYKSKQCPFTVMKIMQEEAFGKLDLSLMSTFFYNVASHYVGDFVLLDSGDIGEIVYVNPRDIFRPLLKIDNKYVDMSVDNNLHIVELI